MTKPAAEQRKDATRKRYERIWRVVAAIPHGSVASYGQVAELAGFARGARLASRALSQAPRDLGLPWHRVIGANGRIAIPKNRPAYKTQRQRLLGEGVRVDGDRVDMRAYRWEPDLDEILWRL